MSRRMTTSEAINEARRCSGLPTRLFPNAATCPPSAAGFARMNASAKPIA